MQEVAEAGVGPTCRHVWETNGDINKDVWIMVEMIPVSFFMGLMTSVGVNRCSLLPRSYGGYGNRIGGPERFWSGAAGPSSQGGRA